MIDMNFFNMLLWAIVFVIIITLFILTLPLLTSKRISFCSKCKSVKIAHSISDFKGQDMKNGTPIVLCKKCGAPMEWRLLPEELFQMYLKKIRMALLTTYPGCLFFFLVFIIPSFYLLLLLIVYLGFVTALSIWLYLSAKKNILRWAQNL